MSKTKRLYIKTICTVIMLSLSFTNNLPSEKALASPIIVIGNATIALEEATTALNNATNALRDKVHQPTQDDVGSASNNSALSIETSRDKFAIGGPIEFFGNLTTTNATMANSAINVTILPTSTESQSVINNITLSLINDTLSIVGRRPPIYQPIPWSESQPTVNITNMTLYAINGSYSYRGLIPFKEDGIYQINATSSDNKTALAYIELVDLFSTYSIRSLLAALGFFFLLIATIFGYGWSRSNKILRDSSITFSRDLLYFLPNFRWIRVSKRQPDKVIEDEDPSDSKSYYIAEILRFISLTGISVSLILSLIFVDVEVNPGGPFGLVNINNNGELNNNAAFTEWAINIGGSANDNYQSGLIIPVYVIVLGLIGGFMRYLNKALAKPEIAESIEKQEVTASGFVQYSLGELSDILIAPILAIAVWFILHQEIQSVFLLAALSLTIGLATPNIISGLKRFASTTSKSTSGSTAS